MRSIRKVISNFKWVLVSLAIVAILFTQVFQITVVPTDSMAPVAGKGSVVFGIRHAKVERGDVVVFDYYGLRLIKRVIAMDGDAVTFDGENVYRDKKIINTKTAIGKTKPLTSRVSYCVPEGCFFVLGDNRENSDDSRVWKYPYVEQSQIKSKSVFSINFSSGKHFHQL